jgi:putative redox protein
VKFHASTIAHGSGARNRPERLGSERVFWKKMKNTFAIVQDAGDDFLVATTPGGHAQTLELNGARGSAASPTDLLLIAVGGCTAADVISILRKKRERVTSYRVEVRSERREEHPRSFRRIEVRHILFGYGLNENAVAKAIELSDQKYCGVAATLRPTAEIVTSYEIHEAPEPPKPDAEPAAKA